MNVRPIAGVFFTGAMLFAQMFPFPGNPPAAAACGSPISTNLKLWISADCVTAISPCSSPANGTTFSSGTVWKDRSSNVNDLSADSAFHGCILRTGAINGLPAVEFPNNCGMLAGAAVDGGSDTTWAVFVVMKNLTTGYKGDFTGGNLTNSTFKYWTGDTKQNNLDKSQIVAIASGTAAADTSWHQMNVVFRNQSSGNSLAYRLDRASDGPASFTSANMTAGRIKFIGIDRPSGYQEAVNGQIAELLIYSATSGLAISSGDTTTNETYLNCRYGL